MFLNTFSSDAGSCKGDLSQMRCMMDVVKICKRDLRVPASSSFRNVGDACGEEDIMQMLFEYIKLKFIQECAVLQGQHWIKVQKEHDQNDN